MSCISDAAITQLASLFDASELDGVKDKKDKLLSRLYTKKITSLMGEEANKLHRFDSYAKRRGCQVRRHTPDLRSRFASEAGSCELLELALSHADAVLAPFEGVVEERRLPSALPSNGGGGGQADEDSSGSATPVHARPRSRRAEGKGLWEREGGREAKRGEGRGGRQACRAGERQREKRGRGGEKERERGGEEREEEGEGLGPIGHGRYTVRFYAADEM
ncbi:MAG: hypothetical protein SGPRY_012331 [Prymnesium sp.]